MNEEETTEEVIEKGYVSNFKDNVEELINSPLFTFMSNGQATSYAKLEKLGMFKNEEVIKLFGKKRLTDEYQVPFDMVLDEFGLLEGDEDE